jgi:hypothetical protein
MAAQARDHELVSASQANLARVAHEIAIMFGGRALP